MSDARLKTFSLWRGRALTQSGLEHIRDHKYKGGAYTPLDNAMNSFWFAVANCMPMWLAPNLITLVALLHMFVGFVIMTYYDPGYSVTAPNWVFLFWAVMLFIYQTLDAVDGKQARRTSSSTPLGQLFDHGCDAFNTVFICDAITSLLQTPELALLNQVLFLSAFFLAQWEEHSTGILRTNMLFMDGKIGVGVSETQIFVMGLMAAAGIFGPGVYATPLVGSWTVGRLLHAAFASGMVMMILLSCKLVWDTEGTTAKRQNAFLQLASPLLMAVVGLSWPVASVTANPKAISLIFGFSMLLCITRMIVFSMAHMHFSAFHSVIFCVLVPYITEMAFAHTVFVYLALVVSMFLYFRFVTGAVTEICEMLSIDCFRIKKQKDVK